MVPGAFSDFQRFLGWFRWFKEVYWCLVWFWQFQLFQVWFCGSWRCSCYVFAATILGLYNVFDNPRQVFAAILDAADYRVLSSQPVPSCPPDPPFFLLCSGAPCKHATRDPQQFHFFSTTPPCSVTIITHDHCFSMSITATEPAAQLLRAYPYIWMYLLSEFHGGFNPLFLGHSARMSKYCACKQRDSQLILERCD